MKFDERFFRIEKGCNSFDFWLKLRNPETQKWIAYPFRNYEHAKGYFDNWQLANFIEIINKDGKWYLKLTFKKVVELRQEKPKGIDL